jgi:hypothetical protein
MKTNGGRTAHASPFLNIKRPCRSTLLCSFKHRTPRSGLAELPRQFRSCPSPLRVAKCGFSGSVTQLSVPCRPSAVRNQSVAVLLVRTGAGRGNDWSFQRSESRATNLTKTPPLVSTDKISNHPQGWMVKASWLALPALASTMLLVVTNHICQNIAIIPFLWVLPLGLYLLSFIICFDSLQWYRPKWTATVPLAAISLIPLRNMLSGSIQLITEVSIPTIMLPNYPLWEEIELNQATPACKIEFENTPYWTERRHHLMSVLKLW